MRVALATALFLCPDLLLLDEPTNVRNFRMFPRFLKIVVSIWISRPSSGWKSTSANFHRLWSWFPTIASSLTMSSPTSFTRYSFGPEIPVFNGSQENRSLTYYKGNYDAFEKIRADARKQQHKVDLAICFLSRYSHFFSCMSRTIKSGGICRHLSIDSGIMRIGRGWCSLVRGRTAGRAAERCTGIKALERLGVVDDVDEDSLFRLDFPDPEPLQKHIVQVCVGNRRCFA